MFNWKFVLYLTLIFNSVWIIAGIAPASDVAAGNDLIHLNSSEDQNAKFNPSVQMYDFDNNVDANNLSFSAGEAETKYSANVPIYDGRVDLASNCAQATALTQRSGYYFIKFPVLANQIALVECDAQTDGGDWTVIQRRQDGFTDFYLDWSQYKVGFGRIDAEHFIGLDKLYALTNFEGTQELLITMETKNSTLFYAKYDAFVIGNESEKYILKTLGKYTGTAGDSLRDHAGCKFSTKDQNNSNSFTHCAQFNKGAWWYNECYKSNLNGRYGIDTNEGIMWVTLTGTKNSLKTVKMMIRRRRY